MANSTRDAQVNRTEWPEMATKSLKNANNMAI